MNFCPYKPGHIFKEKICKHWILSTGAVLCGKQNFKIIYLLVFQNRLKNTFLKGSLSIEHCLKTFLSFFIYYKLDLTKIVNGLFFPELEYELVYKSPGIAWGILHNTYHLCTSVSVCLCYKVHNNYL